MKSLCYTEKSTVVSVPVSNNALKLLEMKRAQFLLHVLYEQFQALFLFLVSNAASNRHLNSHES